MTPKQQRWLDGLLVLFLIGPPLAPLFLASEIRLFELIAGWIIYPLGLAICPQEQHLLPLAGHPMAVCLRCYAALGGLVLFRYRLPPGWRLPRLGLLLALTVVALWQLDVWAEYWGWWGWGPLGQILTGPPLGVAIGGLLYGRLLPPLRPAL